MVLSKIALTGASGMLGRHVRAAMQGFGIQVIAVGRSGENMGYWNLAHWRSLTELDVLFSDVQAIVHAGAVVETSDSVDRELMFNVNVRACANLGEWAFRRGVPVVHISSATVYANPIQGDIREEAPLGWNGLGGYYAFTKLLAEDVFGRLAHCGMKLAVIRPSALYGFGLPPHGLIMRFLAAAQAGNPILLTEPIDDKIDLIHAFDVAQAIIKILRNDAWAVYNVSSGQPLTVAEIAQACINATGSHAILQRQHEHAARAPVTRFGLNADRARKQLDWRPECNISTGLQLILSGRVSRPPEPCPPLSFLT